MPRTYQLAIFDFDGTLVNSDACIRAALVQAFSDQGVVCDTTDLREQIGLPLETIIAARVADGGAPEVIRAIVAAFRRHYALHEVSLISLYPGIRDVLEALHAANILMAIATSKPTGGVMVTLERLGIGGLFRCVVGEDQVTSGKPDPEMVCRVLQLTGCQAGDAILIGDTTFDVAMAAAAGVASCAVSYGNHDAERLRLAAPTFLIDSPRLLRAVLGCGSPPLPAVESLACT